MTYLQLMRMSLKKIISNVLHEFDKTLIYHFRSKNTYEYYAKFKAPEINKIKSKLQEHLNQDMSLNRNQPYNLE